MAAKKTSKKISTKTTKKAEPDFGDCRIPANRVKRDAWRAKNAA